MNVFICLILFSLFKRSLWVRRRVFRVWVYSVVVSWEVNLKKWQDIDHFQTCEDVDMRNVFLHEVSIIKDVSHIVFVILSHSTHACALDHVFPVTDTWRLFVDLKCSVCTPLPADTGRDLLELCQRHSRLCFLYWKLPCCCALRFKAAGQFRFFL